MLKKLLLCIALVNIAIYSAESNSFADLPFSDAPLIPWRVIEPQVKNYKRLVQIRSLKQKKVDETRLKILPSLSASDQTQILDHLTEEDLNELSQRSDAHQKIVNCYRDHITVLDLSNQDPDLIVAFSTSKELYEFIGLLGKAYSNVRYVFYNSPELYRTSNVNKAAGIRGMAHGYLSQAIKNAFPKLEQLYYDYRKDLIDEELN